MYLVKHIYNWFDILYYITTYLYDNRLSHNQLSHPPTVEGGLEVCKVQGRLQQAVVPRNFDGDEVSW